MQLELSKKGIPASAGYGVYRQLDPQLPPGEDRFQDYDHVESLLFEKARQEGMGILAETYRGQTIPLPGLCRGRHSRGHHGI